MTPIKRAILTAIKEQAEREVAELSNRFVHAAQEEREAIIAGLELERWLADSCQECLDRPG